MNNTNKAPQLKPKIPSEKYILKYIYHRYDPPIIDDRLTPIEDITIITGVYNLLLFMYFSLE